MSDTSPNGLFVKPNVTSMGKLPLYALLVALLIMGVVLVYSVNFSGSTTNEVQTPNAVEIADEENPMLLVNGTGFSTEDQNTSGGGIVGTTLPVPEINIENKNPQELQIFVENSANNEMADHILRMRSQTAMEALKSPLIAKRITQTTSVASSGTTSQYVPTPTGAMPDLAELGLNPENSNADKDKEAFFDRSRMLDGAWISNDVRTKGQAYEIKTGTVVPAAMITGINSDLPGNIIAQVTQNVYDTASGQYLILPQGSKLFGIYDSRVIYGQSRVLVAWNRIVYPDGSAITLPAMPGSDMAGNAGFEDEVDNHYLKIFGSAVMMALITGGTSYAVDSVTSDDSEEDSSLQSRMTSALAQQLGQVTTSLLEKNLNIKPTLEIRPGYQFNVVLTRDLVFEKPYTAWR